MHFYLYNLVWTLYGSISNGKDLTFFFWETKGSLLLVEVDTKNLILGQFEFVTKVVDYLLKFFILIFWTISCSWLWDVWLYS